VEAGVEALKAKGNAAFKSKQWSDAAEFYSAGISFLQKCAAAAADRATAADDDSGGSGGGEGGEEKGQEQALRNLHGNHAAALLNLEDWAAAGAAAEAAVACDRMWNKGHYRLGAKTAEFSLF
jgi:hypothetical protein